MRGLKCQDKGVEREDIDFFFFYSKIFLGVFFLNFLCYFFYFFIIFFIIL